MFYIEKINGKKYLKSTILEGLNHYFTTRESFIKTKEPECIEIAKLNKELICKKLDIDTSNLIYPSQTHTANVDIAQIGKSDYPETDGLILANKTQAIFLNFADCTPLIFYDGNIAAVSHAGWRGTAGMIGVKTVQKMIDEFGSDIKNIKCAIGPAISLCCYNVGEDVYKQLISTVKSPDNLYEIRNGEIFVNLKNINKRQLTEMGIKEENIDICPYCTACNNDLFFSYRKENGTTNRHSAIIKL